MKKSLVVLAALGAFAGVASAQSSVTLFGVLDVNGRMVKNGDGGYLKSLTPNGLASSRLGFRGEEDLGSGLKASFWLEADVSLDTGAANATKFFGRRATVSLVSPLGEVRLGRDYTPTFVNLAAFDAYGATGGALGSVLNLINTNVVTGPAGVTGTPIGALGSGAGTLVRADNTVSYFLPGNLGGIYGQVMAAAGEGTTATNGNNRFIGGRIGYAAGPLNVGGAYGTTRNPGNGDLRIWDIGASFALPVVKVSAQYYRAEFEPNGLANRTQKLWTVGLNAPLGQGEIRATYQRSDISGGANNGINNTPGAANAVGLRSQDDARLYAIGYVYNLSKRTAIYADASRLQNRGGSTLALTGGSTANSTDFGLGGRNSTGFDLGVRHSF